MCVLLLLEISAGLYDFTRAPVKVSAFFPPATGRGLQAG